jgi:hypothetical protein
MGGRLRKYFAPFVRIALRNVGIVHRYCAGGIGADEAVRRSVTDEVWGLRVRQSVGFLLRPRFARGYEGQVALSLHFVALLVGYTSSPSLVEYRYGRSLRSPTVKGRASFRHGRKADRLHRAR